MNRNQFIDIDTGEDLYEKLLGKRISIQNLITKLTETRGDPFLDDRKDDEIEMDWNFSGLWYSEGLKYMLDLGKGFKVYFFPNKPKYIYELIPSEDMHIFELDLYKKKKDDLNVRVNFEECVGVFDGINEEMIPVENYDNKKLSYVNISSKYHGCFWRLKPGFKANLLYKCVKMEILDKDKDLRVFYFRKNKDLSLNLIF
jgi:hypothetical protein